MGLFFLKKDRIIITIAVAGIIFMVVFPEITIQSSKTAIAIWLNSIVPVIMPFFIASGFLKGIGMCDRIPVRIYPFVMATLSGYPMGAKICGDYYREERINSEELYRLLSYSMVTGPAFIIGTVGVSMLGSYRLGIVLAISHYGGALLNGLIFGGFKHIKAGKSQSKPDSSEDIDYYSVLTDAMLDSFKSVAIILAYIMVFMILCSALDYAGLEKLVGNPTAEAMIKGIMEMTVGCGNIAMASESRLVITMITSFLVSFGGLSVMGQSLSMLKGCKVRIMRIIKEKTIHGMISVIITFLTYMIMIK